MLLCTSLESIPSTRLRRGSAVAIGKFDGVHVGHQQLLKRAVDLSHERNLTPVVMTFANNPLSFLRPELCPESIMSQQQRIDALDGSGVEVCVMVPFDADLAQVSAERFVREILVGQLAVRVLVVGIDFRFGAGGIGDVRLLRELGARLGFEVEVLEDVVDDVMGKVSSTRVREAIAQGQVADAARILSRYPEVRGTVVHGDARGRDLGFPTANLGEPFEGLRPADGVYAGWALLNGERYAAAISVGANVTFDPEGEPRVEAHLLDFSGDVYGHAMRVRFVERIRGMEKFAGVADLVQQMHQDVQCARSLLISGDPK